MRALLLLAPLGLVLAGCSTYRTYAYTEPVYTVATPAVVATAPVYVAPSYVNPSYDADGDGTPNAFDRYPYDARYH